MVIVGRTLLNCQHALSFEDEEAIWELFNQGLMNSDTLSQLRTKWISCSKIADDTAREKTTEIKASIPFELSDYWFEKAAALGDPIARLHQVEDLPGQELVVGELLNEIVQAGQADAYTYDRAAQFISVRSTELNAHEFEKWGLVACMSSAACDQSKFKTYIETTYVPAQSSEILDYADQYLRGEAVVPDFVDIAEQLPYTVYTPNELDQMRKWVETRNAESDSIKGS